MEMDYKESLEWLFGIQRFGSRMGLEIISHLLGLLGNPQEKFRSVHITGTSGKGSTTAMIASILEAEGYRVGRFIKPHLSSFTERITINEQEISPEEVVRLLNEAKPLVEQMAHDPRLRHPTFFEVVTAIGFQYFAEQKVDFAVLEAGMGVNSTPRTSSTPSSR